MIAMNSAEVRQEWSRVMDTAIRKRPVFVKRTRDYMMLSHIDLIEKLLNGVKFLAEEYVEDDGSVTLSLRDMDIAVNGADEAGARSALASAILEYAEEYYDNFELYSSSPNRSPHLPYVIKALTAGSSTELEASIVCQAGKS